MTPNDSEFETEVTLETNGTSIPESPPFHILFLGDYSGRENLLNNNDSLLSLAQPVEIDRDNFEDVIKSLNIRLHLALQGNPETTIEIDISNLEDFHPDRIYQHVSVFSALRKLRQDLLNPNKFENAAKEVRNWSDDSDQNSSDQETSAKHSENSGNLLDDILSNKNATADSYQNEVSNLKDFDVFIKNIVKPHLIHTDESEQANLISVVDEAISQLMRIILHHKDFQALESAWRGLYFVVRRVETSRSLKLFLLDISKHELLDNLKSSNNLEDTTVYRTIVLKTSSNIENVDFALICGNYEFELDVENTATLIRMAKIANSINSPFITQLISSKFQTKSNEYSPFFSKRSYSGDSNDSKLWSTLRKFSEANSLGITSPKFLTRIPYGAKTNPTEHFSFEEFIRPTEQENYLWSNSSFLLALLLAQSFTHHDWSFRNRMYSEIDNLLTHIYSEDGETKIKSCVEMAFTQSAHDTLVDQGFTPFINLDPETIKLTNLQSVAFDSKTLAGRWR